ncbi:MAG: PorV/PorQ family protein [Bacteroidota bacterium]|nr:PorV/PorQ family protein [Bacteroidota bacterium]
MLPAVAAIALYSTVSAQPGTTGMSFLKIGVGARNVAMGETGVAGAQGGEQLFFNPSLAMNEERSCLSIMHQESVQDITTQYLGAIVLFDGWRMGASLHLSSVEGVEVRTKPGEAVGEFTSRNFALGLSFAAHLGDAVAIGAGGKVLFEKVYVDEAGGFALDAGIHLRPFSAESLRDLTFGASVANIGSMGKLRNEPTSLPVTARCGASYMVPVRSVEGALRMELDAVAIPKEERVHVHGGLEAGYRETIFFRIGYMSGYELKNVSAGAGVAYGGVRLDYAIVPYADSFGTVHTFSLSLGL